MTEDARLKRLRLRSWRRGIKEMDLLLGGFADACLVSLPPAELDLYEALLAENDHDLYAWISGRAAAPAHLAPLLDRVRAHASLKFAQQSDAL